jgi:hypothetical protein
MMAILRKKMIVIYAISSAAGCGATSEAPHPLRELVKRLSIGLPATVTERFAWCNVRPAVLAWEQTPDPKFRW